MMSKQTRPRLEYLEEVDSTNAWCKRQLAALQNGDAVFAGCQTAGRGRLGRTWQSAPGKALYYSILLKRPLADLASLPLAASLAVQAALQTQFGVECSVKWPNDLLLGGKKLVGILCEGVPGGAVCGIGVNLTQSPTFFAAQGLPHATSLQAVTGADLPADAARQLALAISVQFCESPLLEAFYDKGFPAIRSQYKAVCANLDQEVWFEGGEGIAQDLDEAGRLVVETQDGVKAVFTGEVSVRGIYGRV